MWWSSSVAAAESSADPVRSMAWGGSPGSGSAFPWRVSTTPAVACPTSPATVERERKGSTAAAIVGPSVASRSLPASSSWEVVSVCKARMPR